MMRRVRAFLSDDSGATSIEYGLIAGMIFLAIIIAVTNVGSQLKGQFAKVSAGFN